MSTPTKTAMMELIEYITEIYEWMPNESIPGAVKDKATELLETEKTQIVDAHEAGFLSNDLPIEYYNKTYKQ